MSDNINKIMEDVAYHSIGIVPIRDASKDFNRILSGLPVDEARQMKRKFRKLWRKCVTDAKKSLRWGEVYAIQLGMGTKHPTKKQKKRRKEEVKRKIIVNVVKPMTENILSKGKITNLENDV